MALRWLASIIRLPPWAVVTLVTVLVMVHVLVYAGLILPSWVLLTLIATIVTGFGVVLHGPLMSSNKWLWELGDREHSEIAGHFLGVIGVIYAVLLAFVAVVAWQQFDHAEEISMQEQRDVVDLFDAAGAFNTEQRYKINAIKAQLEAYAFDMVGEVLQMRHGEPLCLDSDFGNETGPGCQAFGDQQSALPPSRLNNDSIALIRVRVMGLQPHGSLADQSLYRQSVALFEDLAAVRDHRRHHYEERMPFVLWIAFFIGGFVIVSLPYLGQGPRNSVRQLLRTAALCVMIGLIIGVTYVFDHPFGGDAASSGVRRWCTTLKSFNAGIAQSYRFRSVCRVSE